jgi:integrase
MAVVNTYLQYLVRDRDRHGNERLYVRKRGRRSKIRIREEFGSPAFWKAYGAAVEKLRGPEEATPTKAPKVETKSGWASQTFGWLVDKYFDSPEYTGLDTQSQNTRRSVLSGCVQEPFSDTDPDPIGNCPLQHLTSKKIKRLRDLKVRAGLPGAANNRKKYLSSMFGWAIEAELMATNPARDVKRKKYATEGFHTWTEAEVAAFEKQHPIGTKARLALALYLYLGVRKGDMVKLGPKNIHEPTAPGEPRTIRFTPGKTRYKRLRESVKPILPALEHILERSPTGAKAFLETSRGKPHGAKGFGKHMRGWCTEAGLSLDCTSHGLRKVGATRCAEAGATEYQMMAIFDWDTPAQAATYIKEANRKRMTMTSAHMLEQPRVH